MRNLVFAIGFVGAGLVGAVGGKLLFPAETVGVDLEAPALTESRIEELENRMERLAGEVRAMRQERLAPAPDPLAAVPFDATPGAAPPSHMDAPAAAEPAPAASPGEIEEKVVEIIEAREREQRERKAKWAAAAQLKKEAEWFARMKERLGLTERQVEDMKKLRTERRVKRNELGNRWRALGDAITEEQKTAIRVEMEDFNRNQDAEFRSLLSTTQYEGLMESYKRGGK